ncbi:Hypothetical protein FKW44_018127, partial [Caligus rogercresseyi]
LRGVNSRPVGEEDKEERSFTSKRGLKGKIMSGDEVCREGERAGLCLGGEEEGKDVSRFLHDETHLFLLFVRSVRMNEIPIVWREMRVIFVPNPG